MKKKKSLFVVIRRGSLYIFVPALMLMLAACSKQTIPAAYKALTLCGKTIIPSLFPFFVLSNILIKTGFAHIAGKLFAPIMRTLFKVSGTGGVAFFIGIISGYPMGAKTVCDLYESGELEKSEAERLLPYCNNSGPLFIIGTVGTGMLFSVEAGMLLLVVHIISAILTGIVLRFFCKSEKRQRKGKTIFKNNTKDFGLVFSESVKEAVGSVLFVCGFIVFFASVTAPFTYLSTSAQGSLVCGILEIAGGARSVVENYSLPHALPIISLLLGFGGICVTLQVMGIVKKASLSMKPYIFGKLHQALISYILCRAILSKTLLFSAFSAKGVINFETGNLGAAVTAVFTICAFYFLILTLRKNFKKY